MSPPPSSSNRARTTQLLIASSVLLLLVALANLCFGGTVLTPATAIKALLKDPGANPVIVQIIYDFRIPRILTALLAGAALATAGLIMQTIFRNPLADPFVLGVNSGASLGVALVLLALAPTGAAIINGLSVSGNLLVVASATSGAAATLFVVLLLSRRVDIMSVLIIGLMISYTIGALVSMLMFFSMAERLQAFISWSFGDYGNVGWSQMWVFAPTILIGLVLSLSLLKPLDAMLLGEHYARSIGTATKQVRFVALLIASILAGTVTGFCGPIGFLGIAAPHICRQLFRTSQHHILIPASIVVGALLSVGADFISRGPGLDVMLPLNAITALIGAPIIIAALVRQRHLKRIFG